MLPQCYVSSEGQRKMSVGEFWLPPLPEFWLFCPLTRQDKARHILNPYRCTRKHPQIIYYSKEIRGAVLFMFEVFVAGLGLSITLWQKYACSCPWKSKQSGTFLIQTTQSHQPSYSNVQVDMPHAMHQMMSITCWMGHEESNGAPVE